MSSRVKTIFSAILGIILLTGCSGGRPTPLGLDEIPAAFQKGFQNAKEETRAVASGVVKQVEKRQLGPAAFQLQNMLADRSLTKDQNSLVARALISVNATLDKQIEAQEAAVAAPPSVTPKARATAAPVPLETQSDPDSIAAAKRMREIYRQNK
jgi:hypothetical protein